MARYPLLIQLLQNAVGCYDGEEIYATSVDQETVLSMLLECLLRGLQQNIMALREQGMPVRDSVRFRGLGIQSPISDLCNDIHRQE